ncbi:hypothetical protein CBR_g38649 [Chara braunii]|uniref:Uncharacterized protein n=1 Tax=Chara braunii TaxID=69332 RepID=A0A388K0U6_CHABU|nr:hypothetical protein CBR_g38649 [Chara braunii]|eukprot:GBG63583.1 hypothetical protein CBR_g38649 [Chara braunii]
MEANLGPVLEFVRKTRTTKQPVRVPDDSNDDSGGSATEDIRARTKNLIIHEKRKRGPEVVFDDSPPLVTPAKRTPRRTDTKKKAVRTPGHATMSKAKVRTKLSPYVEKLKKTPGQPSTVEKLRFRNQQMEDLRALGTLELQGICKDEGVAYNGKVDAIFDIASYRTRVHFGDIGPIDLSIVADQPDEESATADDEVTEQEA